MGLSHTTNMFHGNSLMSNYESPGTLDAIEQKNVTVFDLLKEKKQGCFFGSSNQWADDYQWLFLSDGFIIGESP